MVNLYVSREILYILTSFYDNDEISASAFLFQYDVASSSPRREGETRASGNCRILSNHVIVHRYR